MRFVAGMEGGDLHVKSILVLDRSPLWNFAEDAADGAGKLERHWFGAGEGATVPVELCQGHDVLVKEAEPGLISWIEKEVTFPDCMVDRITPVTTPSDIENLKNVYGIDDAWPVVCEPFIQWVIEDNYSNGRPEWESVGVQFVHDVSPYEKMKIRLLNAGHSLLGFSGSLYGCSTIDETVRIPLFGSFLREFMDIEVTPVLGEVEGINLEDYKDSLIQRFGNPNIKDKLSRICNLLN